MQTSVVSAYIIGIVVFIVMLLIAAVVANAIAFLSLASIHQIPESVRLGFGFLVF